MLLAIRKAFLKCEEYAHQFADMLISLLFNIFWTFAWIPVSVKYAFAPSYYPELPRKNALIRIFDNVIWTVKYQRANSFYTLYAMDIAKKKVERTNDIYIIMKTTLMKRHFGVA